MEVQLHFTGVSGAAVSCLLGGGAGIGKRFPQ
jgi:hypothetical protein